MDSLVTAARSGRWRVSQSCGETLKAPRPPLADNQWFLFIGKSTCNSSFRRDLNEIFVTICYWKEIQCQRFLFIPRNLLYQGKHLLVSHNINSLFLPKSHGSDRIWYLWVGFLVCPNSWDMNLSFGNFNLYVVSGFLLHHQRLIGPYRANPNSWLTLRVWVPLCCLRSRELENNYNLQHEDDSWFMIDFAFPSST